MSGGDYTALFRRNTVALDIDTWSAQTGDAVELGHATVSGGRMLLDTLARESRVPMGSIDGNEPAVRCQRRFTDAVARLQHARIEVTDDVGTVLAEYARLRAGWNVAVARLADFLGYTPEQIDVSIERIVSCPLDAVSRWPETSQRSCRLLPRTAAS